MAKRKRPDDWHQQFSDLPDEDELDEIGEEEDLGDRAIQLPPVKSFDSLEDVLAYNKLVLEYLAAGKISGKAIGAYSKLAQIVIASRKTQATVGALGAGDNMPDIAAIRAKPDIEAARPLMVQAADFRGMSDEQRFAFFEGLKTIQRVGNGNGGHSGNGNGAGLEDEDNAVEL